MELTFDLLVSHVKDANYMWLDDPFMEIPRIEEIINSDFNYGFLAAFI